MNAWRNSSRCIRLMVTVVALLEVAPSAASAHPRLVRSEPGAGLRLANVPRLIRLWFSEKPELRLTFIALTDSGGQVVSVGPVGSQPDDPFAVRADIGLELRPGRYTVAWRTAAADGHPVRGTFSFTVLAPATVPEALPRADTPAFADSMVIHRETGTPSGLLYTAVRGVTFACILVIVGAVAFRYGVLARVEMPYDVHALVSGRIASLGAAASLVLVLSAVSRLALQVQVLNAGATSLHTVRAGEIVTSTRWGTAWLLQVVAAAVSFAAFWIARRWSGTWWLAGVASLVLAITPALSGHAGTSPRLPGVALAADAAHIIAASGWLGSLLMLIAVAIPSVTARGGEQRWQMTASLVNAFSPTALAYAGILVLTGTFAAWLHLGSLSALWTSGYGRVLSLKLGVLFPLVATGTYNWRRVRPALGTSDATARLWRSAGFELAVGIVVIGVTAVLVATEPPLQ